MKHFFDIGANDGDTFDLYLYKKPEYYGWKVWCFEPSPRWIEPLCKKAEEARKLFDVIVCPFGLSGKNQLLPLYERNNNTKSDTFHIETLYGAPLDFPTHKVICSTISISDFIPQFTKEDDEIVMKIDCEGCEYGILENLLANPHLLDRISLIINEWHPSYRDMNSACRERTNKITDAFSRLNKPLQSWMF